MAVTMARCAIGVGDGVELCVETYGDVGDPTLLLLAGATSSMDAWDPELCARLAGAGRYVVRYDHRDTGESTTWPVGAPGYTGEDLSLDPLRLLDALGVPAAHLVGISMGGGIAQDLAVRFPDRVLSLTLMATSPALERADPAPLPPMRPEVLAVLERDGSALDRSDADAVVEEQVRVESVFAGPGFDEPRAREAARRTLRRAHDVRAAVVNHWQVIGAGDDDGPVRRMSDIHAPTLVVHGRDDPMFPLPHGEALAREIPDAVLLVVDGMGHGVPPPSSWDVFVPALLAHTKR